MISQWRIVYDEHIIYLKHGYEMALATVFSCAWKANDGKQDLINYHDRETECTVELPVREYYLYSSTAGKKMINGRDNTIKIAPLSAVLIEEA